MCVRCVAPWVRGMRGLCGLHGSKYFLPGSAYYVGHNFHLSCVGQDIFLRGSKIFCVVLKCLRYFFCGGKLLFT